MAKRGPLSAAHKAAISAGLKRYHAGRGSSGGSSKRSGPVSFIPSQVAKTAPPKKPKATKKSGSSKPPVAEKINKPQRVIKDFATGKPISREEAARIMFGSAGARKKLAAGKKARRR